MRVVINKCHGGFGISVDALYELIKMNSDIVTKMPIEEYTHDVDRTKKEFESFKNGFMKHKCLEILFDGKYIYFMNRHAESVRCHPDLINIVEKLGDAANGASAKLKIVKIPDDVEWTIEEYDGLEWVAEKHRTWG